MTPADLESLREGWDFEAKLAAGRDGRGELPSSLWETYSAMANTEGGLILLGAKERSDGSFDLKGITDIGKVERDLWNTLQNPQKVSANILKRDQVERVDVGGSTLLLLHIPKAVRCDRPVYIDGSWERGTYVRVHEGDRRVDREVARRMLADAVGDRDSGLVDEFGLDDFDMDSVRSYRNILASNRGDHPFAEKNDEDFLYAIGAVGVDRTTARKAPTWAGLWMLGKERSICDVLPHWRMSYKEVSDDPRDPTRWLDRVHPDGTWNANLFQFYLRVIRKLHEGLKVPFALEASQFRIDDTSVHKALREALVNTLVHADYQGTTGLRVIRRRSGFEFINPGLLLVSAEQVWRGGISEPRNPALQKLFALVRLGEREGSGGPVMRQAWRERHWRAPRIWQDVEHGETHLQLAQESLLSEDAVNALAERWGHSFTKQDELGRVILATAEAEDGISHARVRELSDEHSRDITLKFQELVRNGMLESSRGGRNTTYAPRMPDPGPLFARISETGPPTAATSPGSDATSASAAISDPNAATSDPNAAVPAPCDATSPGSDATSPTSDATSHPAIARVRQQGRVPSSVLDDAIVAVCEGTYLTREEIAEQVNRAVNSLRARSLPRLVKEGRLVLKFPERPNHPRQAYRAADREGEE